MGSVVVQAVVCDASTTEEERGHVLLRCEDSGYILVGELVLAATHGGEHGTQLGWEQRQHQTDVLGVVLLKAVADTL